MYSFSHILAGFSLGFSHRRELLHLLDSTPTDSSITKLDPEVLRESGIAALALDFDGVLAHHGAETPLTEAVDWMKQCVAIFGEDRIFVLSNKPTDERRQWFAEHFPAIRFISGVPKKPYPDGIKKTGELAGVPLSSIMMVDDRLLTGCLAALAAGARPCYIHNPYISIRHRPLAELFFICLRSSERILVKALSLC
jgi:predicted HAD superfamily phosphohydrolase YqeG